MTPVLAGVIAIRSIASLGAKKKSTHADLLLKILEQPDDDAPRLIYADALQGASGQDEDDDDDAEEQRARGELITIQCELARNGWDGERIFLDWIGDERVDVDTLDGGRFAKLRRREAEILREYGAKWIDRKTPALRAEECYRRGFVEHLYVNANEKLGELFKRYPLLRSIFTTLSQPDRARAFFRSPELRKVRELSLQSPVIRFMVDLEHDNLTSLRYLSLQNLGGPHDLDALANARWFSNLEVLVLYSFSLNAKVTTSLGSRLAHVRELQIVDSRMGHDAASELVGSGALRHVRTLALRHARLGEGDASLFTLQKDWSALTALDLRTNTLRAKDAEVIAEHCPSLRVLDVGNNPTFASGPTNGLAALTALRGLKNLRSLSLQKTGLEDFGLQTLAPLLKTLRVLDLRKNTITEEGITKLLLRNADARKRLRVLYIGTQASPVTKKALKNALPETRIY